MCTVSFCKTKDGYSITSNRDEKISRERAIPPKEYFINNQTVTFPKDPKAGGTWFAQRENHTLVLLNGAVEKHITKPNYRKSRGLIVLELISSINILESWNTIDLQDIEPFTLVYFDGTELYQMQWNEIEKSIQKLNTNENYIWSSSTLYNFETRLLRQKWFKDFIGNEKEITAQKLLNFHQFTENNNKDFGLQINRGNILKTVSITQCNYTSKTSLLTYLDLY